MAKKNLETMLSEKVHGGEKTKFIRLADVKKEHFVVLLLLVVVGRYTGEGIGYPFQYSWVSACNVGDLGWIPGLGRSPGEGKGYPLQYSGLENSMDYTVHGVTKSRTRLSDFHFT